jgi:hypothetical protein
MEWNEVVNIYVPLFGFVKIQWSGIRWNPFHHMSFNLLIFYFSQFGVYAME